MKRTHPNKENLTPSEIKIYLNKQRLVEVIPAKKPIRPTRLCSKMSSELSPHALKIINSIPNKESRKIAKKLFQKDDEQIDSYTDSDYLQSVLDPFKVEEYFSDSGRCICGKKLHLYNNQNTGLCDLECVDREYHYTTNTPFRYQLKTSSGTGYFSGKDGKEFITPGSMRYGHIAHTMDCLANPDDKFIIPAYICIKFFPQKNDLITIDYNKSFILIPKLELTIGGAYFQYAGPSPFGKPTITWNKNLVDKLDLSDMLSLDHKKINLNNQYDRIPYIMSPSKRRRTNL